MRFHVSCFQWPVFQDSRHLKPPWCFPLLYSHILSQVGNIRKLFVAIWCLRARRMFATRERSCWMSWSAVRKRWLWQVLPKGALEALMRLATVELKRGLYDDAVKHFEPRLKVPQNKWARHLKTEKHRKGVEGEALMEKSRWGYGGSKGGQNWVAKTSTTS